VALYADIADLQDYYDWREIGDLLTDSDEQVSALDQVTTGNLYNTRLLRFLSRASAEVEAIALKGGRYSVTDLSGLTGNSAEFLSGIVCELVMMYLFERKKMYKPEMLETLKKSAAEKLKLLGDGDNVLNLPLVIDAGTVDIDGPTTTDYSTNLNLVPDRVKGYPRRALPFNR
jgi:hypothetical protein